MPKARPKGSVGEKELLQWLRTHEDAPGAEVARARLEFQELEGQARFLRGLLGQTRVRPRVLVTSQVSGRWSTTGPNLPGRPKAIKATATKQDKDVIVPDWGWWWLRFDWVAVEGRLAATFANERRDLGPLERGEDIHIATLKDMFPGEEIRNDDPRRQLAKTTRYNLQYAYDHRGILDAPDLGVFGGRAAALEFAQRYLHSRPALQAAKARVFAESVRTGQARSAFGRLRRLTGDEKGKAKDGWSQTIQGTVSGMMNRVLVEILGQFDEGRLVLNEHDGATLAFPVSHGIDATVAWCRPVVEKTWSLWGLPIACPADWCTIVPDAYGVHSGATQDTVGGVGEGARVVGT